MDKKYIKITSKTKYRLIGLLLFLITFSAVLANQGLKDSYVDNIFDNQPNKKFITLIGDEGLDYKGPEFKLEDKREEITANQRITYLEAVGESGAKADVQIVKDVDDSFARDYIEQEKIKATSRFKGTAPYTSRPGGGECPNYIIPNTTARTESPPRIEIESYGFGDISQGSCSELEPDQKSKIWVIYCESARKVFKIKISSDLTEEIFEGMKFGCKY